MDRNALNAEPGGGPQLQLEGEAVNSSHVMRSSGGATPAGYPSPRAWPTRPPPHHPYRGLAPRHPYYPHYRHHPGVPPYGSVMHPYPGAPAPPLMGRRQHLAYPGPAPYGVPPPGYGMTTEEDVPPRNFQSPFLGADAQEAVLGMGMPGPDEDFPQESIRQMHSEGGAIAAGAGAMHQGGAAAGGGAAAAAGGPGPTSSDGGATSAVSAGGGGAAGAASGGVRGGAGGHYPVGPPPPPGVYGVPYGVPYRSRHMMYSYPPAPPSHYFHPEDVPGGPYGRRLAGTHSVPVPGSYGRANQPPYGVSGGMDGPGGAGVPPSGVQYPDPRVTGAHAAEGAMLLQGGGMADPGGGSGAAGAPGHLSQQQQQQAQAAATAHAYILDPFRAAAAAGGKDYSPLKQRQQAQQQQQMSYGAPTPPQQHQQHQHQQHQHQQPQQYGSQQQQQHHRSAMLGPSGASAAMEAGGSGLTGPGAMDGSGEAPGFPNPHPHPHSHSHISPLQHAHSQPQSQHPHSQHPQAHAHPHLLAHPHGAQIPYHPGPHPAGPHHNHQHQHQQHHQAAGNTADSNNSLRRAFSADAQQLRLLAAQAHMDDGGAGSGCFPADMPMMHAGGGGGGSGSHHHQHHHHHHLHHHTDLHHQTAAQAAAAAAAAMPSVDPDLTLPLPELLTQLGSPSAQDEEEQLHAELHGLIGDLADGYMQHQHQHQYHQQQYHQHQHVMHPFSHHQQHEGGMQAPQGQLGPGGPAAAAATTAASGAVLGHPTMGMQHQQQPDAMAAMGGGMLAASGGVVGLASSAQHQQSGMPGLEQPRATPMTGTGRRVGRPPAATRADAPGRLSYPPNVPPSPGPMDATPSTSAIGDAVPIVPLASPSGKGRAAGTTRGSPTASAQQQQQQQTWRPTLSSVRQLPKHPPLQQQQPSPQTPRKTGGAAAAAGGGGRPSASGSGSGRLGGDEGGVGEDCPDGAYAGEDGTENKPLPRMMCLNGPNASAGGDADAAAAAAAAEEDEEEEEDEDGEGGPGEDSWVPGGSSRGGAAGRRRGTANGSEDGEATQQRRARRKVAARRLKPRKAPVGRRDSAGSAGGGAGPAGASATSGDELQLGARPTVEQLLSQSVDTVADLEVLGDLEPQTVTALLEKVQRKGKGGRAPAEDPRLDPSIDPRKARRILANRISAARSKLKQKLILEGLKARYQQLLSSKNEYSRELADLRRACKELETRNRGLAGRLKQGLQEMAKEAAQQGLA